MRNLLFAALALFSLSSFGTEGGEENKGVSVNSSKPVTYIAAIVRRGDNWQQDSLRAFELQEKHLKFLENLKTQDKLIASGPLTSSSDARGLYVFNVKSIEEAQALTNQDEAVSSGWIKMDFHVWASRDYDVSQPELVNKESESENPSIFYDLGWTAFLLAIFIVWIIILAYRTFRMKASA